MKTIFAAIGVLALATSAAYAEGGDGGKDQSDFYAVVRGDYRAAQTEQFDARTSPLVATSLRRSAAAPAAQSRQSEYESPNR